MKLELKKEQLVPYSPYSLKVIMEGKKTNVAWMSTKHIAVIRPDGIGEYKKIKWEYAHLNIKPILNPLSEMYNIEEIMDEFSEYHLEKFEISFSVFGVGCTNRFDHVNYTQMKLFFKHHLDIFGLIKEGLAIDINTLN